MSEGSPKIIVRLKPKIYDALMKIAAKRGENKISEIVRDALKLAHPGAFK